MPGEVTAGHYRQALGAFVSSSSEASLEAAYEIGRDALQAGLSLGDVGELHYSATRDLIADQQITLAMLAHCEEFFLQIAAVYDMALRGYRDTIQQLHLEVAQRRKVEQQLRVTAAERDLLQERVAERTETLRLQADELTRKNEELKQRNSQLDDFAHIASHDLKEPLRAISMHASILLDESETKLDENARSRLDRLAKLTCRMEQLIAGLLHYSNLSHAVQMAETVDIMEVIKGIEATLIDTLQMRNARIVVTGVLPPVRGNKSLLTSLFQNLISNGTKYSEAPEKIVEIGIAADAGDKVPADMEVLYVRDNGIGIEEQFQEDIFRIFKRLNSEKTYGEGSGAGLAFVKKIVEIQGGRIWLTSQSGKGTTFYFTLMKSS